MIRYETVPEYIERGGVITYCHADPRIEAARWKGVTARGCELVDELEDEAVSELPVVESLEDELGGEG